MGRSLGLLGLLIALAIGAYLWMERSRSIPDELRVMSPAAAVTIKPPTALDRHARLDAE